MKKRREIFVTNDDSINSKGIKELISIMQEYGNVTVIAPDAPQSGKSVALSMDVPLRLREVHKEQGLSVYKLNGTPTDCTKMAINRFFQGNLPDLMVSGINHGSNASIACVYSGTLGATIEGTIYGIPSIGFSLNDHSPEADFSSSRHFIKIILDRYFEHPYMIKEGVYFNVNIPALPIEKIKGIKFARQGAGKWIKEFTHNLDPHGREYSWMTGEFENLEEMTSEADHIFNHHGYVTIVPHKVDSTDYQELKRLIDLNIF